MKPTLKNIVAIFIFLLPAITALAQSTNNFPIYWDSEPKAAVASATEAKESAFYVFKNIRYEYKVSLLSNTAEEYFTSHIRIHINDDKAVESFNKIELPSTDKPFMMLKARTITKDGKVIDIPESAIKDKTDEESGRKYKIFAMEGMQPNCDIEYIYTMPVDFELQNRDIFQGSLPCREAKFEIYAPYYLELKVLPFNGFGKVVIDTTNPRFTYYKTTANNLVGIESETYCNKILYLAHVEFGFYRNTDSKKQEPVSWNKLGGNYNEAIYIEPSDKKKMQKYLSAIDDYTKLSNKEEKIIWIEEYFKTNFQITTDIKREDAYNWNFVFKNKLTSETGFTKLLYTAYQSADIEVNLALTSSKTQITIDTSLPSTLYLKEALLYFPEFQHYVIPDQPFLRYPYIPDYFEANKVLLIKPFKESGVQTTFGELANMPLKDCNYTYHNIYANVTFDIENEHAIVDYKQTLSGHRAATTRPIFVLYPTDKKTEAFKEMANIGNIKEDVFENIIIKNEAFSNIKSNIPLELSAKITTSSLLEKAGKAYVFKVGKLIGRQEEMYQEKERICDIDVDMLHHLKRELTLTIPEGYTAKNLDKLNLDVRDGTKYGFLSSYKQAGNIITISLDEYYCASKLPKTDINKFRATINAAADFEKLVILLEKQ
jgi:Domain of Unknown Function with PDB structure (DUF3857)